MIELRPSTDKSATYERLDNLLSEHAKGEVGQPFSNETLVLEAFDGDVFLGGVYARVGTEWVFIELLALHPDARGRGIGANLVNAVETHARSGGKTGVWLDTYSFQAPQFYRKLGYEVVGEIKDYPKGHSRIFLAKYLTQSE